MKIGFVKIGHEDYLSDLSKSMEMHALKQLDDGKIETVCIDIPVTDTQQGVLTGIKLSGADVDGVILYLSTWVECSVVISVIREIEHLPMLLWGFPMFESEGKLTGTGSYVSYSMFKGVMDRVGYKYTGVLGMYDDESVIKTIHTFCNAAAAKKARQAAPQSLRLTNLIMKTAFCLEATGAAKNMC